MKNKLTIVVNVIVDADKDQVWGCFTQPEHITNWNFATDEWQCPKAESELKPDGQFNYRMEAKDGSMGFDFKGIFTNINAPHVLEYTLKDGRRVSVSFIEKDNFIEVTESFEAENENSIVLQEQS